MGSSGDPKLRHAEVTGLGSTRLTNFVTPVLSILDTSKPRYQRHSYLPAIRTLKPRVSVTFKLRQSCSPVLTESGTNHYTNPSPWRSTWRDRTGETDPGQRVEQRPDMRSTAAGPPAAEDIATPVHLRRGHSSAGGCGTAESPQTRIPVFATGGEGGPGLRVAAQTRRAVEDGPPPSRRGKG
jgi:hypothetical protein